MDSLNKGISSIHHKVNLLTSFSSIYKNPVKKIELPNNRDKLMIDSGAFDLLIKGKLEDFPFSPEEYANTIKNLVDKPDYAISMDYICTQEENNNNIELIQKTIKNAEILRKEFERDSKICFVPVVQGYYLNEYLYCIKEMVKKKIIQSGDYIGIGSLAARKKVKEARQIIGAIYNYLKKSNLTPKIHCFGLNLNILKDYKTFNMINSIDSLAWTFPYRFGRVKIFTRERMIEANTNGILQEPEFYYLSLNASLKYIDFLNLKYSNYLRKNCKSILNSFSIKNENEKLKAFKKIALMLGVSENKLKKIKTTNLLFDIIIKQNEKFPREKNWRYNKIPAFTGEKFVFLEPKNTNIGKIEFLYLLITALENALIKRIIQKKNDNKTFFQFLKKIEEQINDSQLNQIKKLLLKLNSEEFFEFFFHSEKKKKDFGDFFNFIKDLREKLELKLYKFDNQSKKKQMNLQGKKIRKELYLLIDNIEI